MTLDPKLKRSRLQEKKGAKRFEGVQHAGSGNQWQRKNDVHSDTDLVEFKDTSNKKSISLKVGDLTGVMNQAAIEGRRGILGFHLAGIDYVVMLDADYQEMRQRCDRAPEG